MRREEQNFWQTVKSHKPPEIWAQRVENGVATGMPDVFLASKFGKQSWLELKVAKEPARKTTPLLKRGDIRIPQINWHMKAAAVKIPSFIAVRTDHNQIYLIRGEFAPDAHKLSFIDWQDWRIDGWGEFWDIFI